MVNIRAEGGKGDAELSHSLGMVSDEITRLEGSCASLLEFSRPPVLHLEAQELGPIVNETLELVSRGYQENRVSVARRYADGLPQVLVDRKQLKQLLINLLNNAAEAISGGGEICVTAEAASDGVSRSMVVVRVKDTGPGVREEVQKRLFEPFFTTKENGTGLGLCIAAGIMTRHGGQLLLESSTTQGAVFAVWIPAI